MHHLHLRNRLIVAATWLLTVALLAVSFALPTFAEEPTAYATYRINDGASQTAATEQEWRNELAGLSEGSKLQLQSDLVLTAPLALTRGITLDLGGHTISFSKLATLTGDGKPAIELSSATGATAVCNGTIRIGEDVGVRVRIIQKTKDGALTLSGLTVTVDRSVHSALGVSGAGNVTIDGCRFLIAITDKWREMGFVLGGSGETEIRDTLLNVTATHDSVANSTEMKYANPSGIQITGTHKQTVRLINSKIIAPQQLFFVHGTSTDENRPVVIATDCYLVTTGPIHGEMRFFLRADTAVDLTVERSYVNSNRGFSTPQIDITNSENLSKLSNISLRDTYFKIDNWFCENLSGFRIDLENTVLSAVFNSASKNGKNGKNVMFYIGSDVRFYKAADLGYAKLYDKTQPSVDPDGTGTYPTMNTPSAKSFAPTAGKYDGERFEYFTGGAAVNTALSAMRSGETLYIYQTEYDQATWTVRARAEAQGADIGVCSDGDIVSYLDGVSESMLRSLLEGAASGATFRLMRDYELTATVVVSASVGIDLNGKTLRVLYDTATYPAFTLRGGADLYFYSSAPDATVAVDRGYTAADGTTAFAPLFCVESGRLNLGRRTATELGEPILYRCATAVTMRGECVVQTAGGTFLRADGAPSGAAHAFFRVEQVGEESELSVTGGLFHDTIFGKAAQTGVVRALLDGCRMASAETTIYTAFDGASADCVLTLRGIEGGSVTKVAGVYVILGDDCRFGRMTEQFYFGIDGYHCESGVELATSGDGAAAITSSTLPKLKMNLTLTDAIRLNFYAPKGANIRINCRTLTPYDDRYDAYRFDDLRFLPQNAHEYVIYKLDVFLDETMYSVARMVSITDYMARVMADPTQSAQSKELIRALGAYMCEAVRYADPQNIDAIAKIHSAVGGYTLDAIAGEEGTPNGGVVHSIGIILNNAPQYALYLKENRSDVTLRHWEKGGIRTIAPTTVEQTTVEGVGVYKYVFTLPTYAFGDPVTFVIDGTQFTYSLANYVKGQEAKGNLDRVGPICNALHRYTAAAKQYLGVQ